MSEENAGANAGSKKNRGEEGLNLRVGKDMRTAVFAEAEREGRSVNAYCKDVLEQALKNPERGRALALRSLAELKKQVDRVRAAGVLSDDRADALLETVEAAVHEVHQEQPNPAPEPEPKKRSWRFPVPGLLSGLFESEEDRE